MITEALAKAIDRASEAGAEEQARIAALILEELEADHRWDDLVARSKGKLSQMANEAIAEHRAGKTIPLPQLRP